LTPSGERVGDDDDPGADPDVRRSRAPDPLPPVMVGTSPFLGAGQFGHRALLYRRTFYEKPENITALLEYCALELGVEGVQPIADPVIVDAILAVDADLRCVTVVGLHDLTSELELAAALDSEAVLLHANRVDGRPVEDVCEDLDEVRENWGTVGIATHEPHVTLPRWESSGERVDVYMVPLNPLGAFMGDKETVETVLKNTETVVVAKKVLAAGRLPPSEGIPYAARLADAMALGVTSRGEADETLTLAMKFMGSPSGADPDGG